MPESVTFAVDAAGQACFVAVSGHIKKELNIEKNGAIINDWPGNFPENLKPNFYTGTVQLVGEEHQLVWSDIEEGRALINNKISLCSALRSTKAEAVNNEQGKGYGACVTFVVDAFGCSQYVGLPPKLYSLLSIDDAGASIDEWPGDFPTGLKSGFYQAYLQVSGSVDDPRLHWSEIDVVMVLTKSTTITKIPEHEEKEKVRRPRKGALERSAGAPMGVRIRRKGEVVGENKNK